MPRWAARRLRWPTYPAAAKKRSLKPVMGNTSVGVDHFRRHNAALAEVLAFPEHEHPSGLLSDYEDIALLTSTPLTRAVSRLWCSASACCAARPTALPEPPRHRGP